MHWNWIILCKFFPQLKIIYSKFDAEICINESWAFVFNWFNTFPVFSNFSDNKFKFKFSNKFGEMPIFLQKSKDWKRNHWLIN